MIHDTESALDCSLALADAPIEAAHQTSISGAIHFALRLFEKNEFEGKRRILDISGDGPDNFGDYVAPTRDRAVAVGITINGLPVMNGEPRGEVGRRSPILISTTRTASPAGRARSSSSPAISPTSNAP